MVRIVEVRLALRIFLALLIFQVTGLPTAAMAIIEHVEGDGCCPTGCSDDGRCEDCACCFHVRPMLPQRDFAIAPIARGDVALDDSIFVRPNPDPREILHIPRRSHPLFS